MYHIHITKTANGKTTEVVNTDAPVYALVAQTDDDDKHTYVQFMLQDKNEILKGNVEDLIKAMSIRAMTAQQVVELGIQASIKYDCLDVVLSYFNEHSHELGYVLNVTIPERREEVN